VSWPGRTLRREGVTLQAKQVNLTHAQVSRIGGAMGSVTTIATLRFNRHVFIDKRPCLFSVALDANRIPAGHGPHLAQSSGAVSIMAIAAADQPLIDPMVIGLGKICFGGRVAAVAEIRLGPHQQMLGFVCMMGRVAIQAPDAAPRMHRRGKVPLFVLLTMATETKRIDLLRWHGLEADDLGHVSTSLRVRGSWAMTRLASMSIVERSLEMRRSLEVVFVQILVARLASIRSDVLSRTCRLRFGCFLFLAASAAPVEQP